VLEGAPWDGRALLELGLAWPELDAQLARLASRLRVFGLTWDPLEWLAGHADGAPGWATATRYVGTLLMSAQSAVQVEDVAMAERAGKFGGSVRASGQAIACPEGTY